MYIPLLARTRKSRRPLVSSFSFSRDLPEIRTNLSSPPSLLSSCGQQPSPYCVPHKRNEANRTLGAIPHFEDIPLGGGTEVGHTAIRRTMLAQPGERNHLPRVAPDMKTGDRQQATSDLFRSSKSLAMGSIAMRNI